MNNETGPKQSDIAQKASDRRKPVFDPTGRVEALTSEEVLVADVRQHIIGLIFVYLQITIAIGLALFLIVFLLPSLSDVLGVSVASLNAIAAAISLFTMVFGLLFAVLATRIYKGNQLIVSDQNVTQVLQIGLFNRKVSELSMANVEDVTAQQSGIFPTMFNYGILRIETAGEQNNFIYKYCPNPNAYAKAILDARLNFIKEHGE
jgi:uncharacterized membrane protein YdbT with pleckstrin-like domain